MKSISWVIICTLLGLCCSCLTPSVNRRTPELLAEAIVFTIAGAVVGFVIDYLVHAKIDD